MAHTCTVVAFDSAYFEHRLRVCGKVVILFKNSEGLQAIRFVGGGHELRAPASFPSHRKEDYR